MAMNLLPLKLFCPEGTPAFSLSLLMTYPYTFSHTFTVVVISNLHMQGFITLKNYP